MLTGPDNQSALIGLGELKAGFDSDLLEQLFVKSDRRAVTGPITFIGPDGTPQVRTLTREFNFKNGPTVAVNKPPV